MLELEREAAEPPPAPTDGDPAAPGDDFPAYYRALMERLPPPDPDDHARRAAVRRLEAQHPGRHLAYRVVRSGDRFTAEPVAVGESFGEVYAVVDALPDAERKSVALTYSEPPLPPGVCQVSSFGWDWHPRAKGRPSGDAV